MTAGVLVAAQLSSLVAPAQPIQVQSSQKNTYRSSQKHPSNQPLEHASYATFASDLTSAQEGTVLLRVLHGARILELISLDSESPSLRFDFPAPILPYPSLQMTKSDIYVVALTAMGSLYRITIPLVDRRPVLHPQTNPHWCHEYILESMAHGSNALSHVLSPHGVVISLPNGSLLRVETDVNEIWHEYPQTLNRIVGPFARLLPHLSSTTNEDNEIISITSVPPPTDCASAWALSRDRTVRLFKPLDSAFSAELALPTIGRAGTQESTPIPVASKPPVLLPPEPQRLLHAFSDSDDYQYVVAFIPTESSSASGGSFHLLKSTDRHIELLQTFEASSDTAHCHLQHFVVSGQEKKTVYALWDRQGQSMVQEFDLDLGLDLNSPDSNDSKWRTTTYPAEVELTPDYLDELLLVSGSLTDKLFEAIMRPGMFSPLTLQVAVDQYTDACRSLPPPHPPQLLTTYATVGEHIAAVVGCTVKLTRDPHTGAPQHSKYWNALKRDWEGFIARCREVERSARRPLTIAIKSPEEGLVVLERERVASAAGEDPALMNTRFCLNSAPTDPRWELLDLVWMIKTKLGPRALIQVENRLVDIVHQEIAFPFADIVQDSASRLNFREQIDEGFDSWISGRLTGIKDVTDGMRAMLDLIGGFDPSIVKSEEPEVALQSSPLPPMKIPEWKRALTASYATVTVHARYDLSLALMTLLFYLADELHLWSPSLLAEIFVVFRGIAMLRYVVRQPAGDIVSLSSAAADDDDVVASLRNMHVGIRRSGHKPTHSLVHRLIVQHGGQLENPSAAAHLYLDTTGLLQSASPAHATKAEVVFCESLRLLGYREVARELLAWLPRTPAVTYVLGRLWLDEGRYDDAASALESIAGSLGPECGLSPEDREALTAILPGAVMFSAELDYYHHVASLFRSASATSYDVSFTQLALAAAEPDVDTSSLWHSVIRGLTDLGLYEDAYASLVSTPYDKLRRECISQLVYRMCEEDAVERLMSFNFVGVADEVEDSLAFKARNADPRVRPFYSRILYSWYVSRGDYRSAALTMYQRARKLASLIGDPANFISLVELQLEAYVVSMNALALIDQKNAWIVIPMTAEAEHEPRKRRRLSKHIPEDKYTLGKRDAEIVALVDMQYEYTLLSARLELIRRDPTLLSAGELLLAPTSIVMRLAQMNRFNMAMATARSLDIDMSDLFSRLTNQCLRLSTDAESVITEDTSDWLLTDKVSSWPGTPAERGWRYLRQSLECHDGPATDYRFTKVTLETVLDYDRASPPPPWLIQVLEIQHPEYLIRTCMRYDLLESALEHTLSLMRKSDARLSLEHTKTASATWLPYTLIDQVLLAAESQDDLSSRGKSLLRELRKELTARIGRAQKMSQAAQ